MQAVLMSVQPYWVFLIVAKTMGWNIDKGKTVEVRKSRPMDKSWNKVVKIYCSKDMKSFARIPKEYQPFMARFLGKVVGEFVCDSITEWNIDPQSKGYFITSDELALTGLTYEQLHNYGNGKTLCGWHISNLIIYDKPKELSEFLSGSSVFTFDDNGKIVYSGMKRPPQSWCYVEECKK